MNLNESIAREMKTFPSLHPTTTKLAEVPKRELSIEHQLGASKDTARLDWLNANISCHHTQMICGVHADVCGDIRTAIDCAMKGIRKP